MQIQIPPPDDDRRLRHVEIDGYELVLWDTHRTGYYVGRYGKSILGYAFGRKGEAPIFIGEDFGCPPSYAVDSDASLRCLLGFLTLRPGDTDSEYFEKYTEAQKAFAEGDAEALQIWAMEEADDPPAFVNLDGWDDA